MFPILINALRETLYMVLYSSMFSIMLGIPLGLILAQLSQQKNGFSRMIFVPLNTLVQSISALPYVVVMLLFIPNTNWLINHQISFNSATIIPLSVAGGLILAKELAKHFIALQESWQKTIKSMGASNRQSMWHILLPESFSFIIEECCNIASKLVGFSIVAGAFGAGGLGQLAIEKTITEPNFIYATLSILALIAIQQILKYTALIIVPLKS